MTRSLNVLSLYPKFTFRCTGFILKTGSLHDLFLQILCYIFFRSKSNRRVNVFLPNTPAKISGLFWKGHVPNPEPITTSGERYNALIGQDWYTCLALTSVKSTHHWRKFRLFAFISIIDISSKNILMYVDVLFSDYLNKINLYKWYCCVKVCIYILKLFKKCIKLLPRKVVWVSISMSDVWICLQVVFIIFGYYHFW